MRKLHLTFILTILVYSNSVAQDIIDEYSLSSCFVKMWNSKKYLGHATGFFLTVNSQNYFITNEHVVGKVFANRERLRDKKPPLPPDSIPSNIDVRVYGRKLNSSTSINFNVKDIGTYIQLWSDTLKTQMMDVVAVPLPKSQEVFVTGTTILSEVKSINPKLILQPTTDLYIVGFPLGTGYEMTYPLWKRGSIASDPSIRPTVQPNFLVDATTRGGMSGSPVFYRGNNILTTGGVEMYTQSQTYLVGVYSAQDSSREIGQVWKISAIVNSIIRQQKRI